MGDFKKFSMLKSAGRNDSAEGTKVAPMKIESFILFLRVVYELEINAKQWTASTRANLDAAAKRVHL